MRSHQQRKGFEGKARRAERAVAIKKLQQDDKGENLDRKEKRLEPTITAMESKSHKSKEHGKKEWQKAKGSGSFEKRTKNKQKCKA
eukprot:2581981-Pleurochrysis_carterae.AAC.1